MLLTGNHLSEVSFPVGGIGAGCIGIDGQGRLREWEILNHPGKELGNWLSHFAIRAEKAGELLGARILNGLVTRDLSGEQEGPEARFHGFGMGVSPESLCGLPHFRSCQLDGAFPVANYDFSDPAFPGKVSLCAFSPFIPGESDTSSMPAAFFEIHVTNTTDKDLTYNCVGLLSNFWQGDNAHNRVVRQGKLTQLFLTNDVESTSLEAGQLVLSTDAPECSFQEYLFRGTSCDQREVYARELFTAGAFKNRSYGSATASKDSGLIAAVLHLAPGQGGIVRFIISWYVPNASNFWEPKEDLEKCMAISGIKENRWRNYYVNLCHSAGHAAEILFNDYDRIRREVFAFRDAIHSSTLPEAPLQGACENLSVLISPTCLRLEDGTLWGWEGVWPRCGSCYGSCQHVWNYAQALSMLFPDLERTMRESQLRYNLDVNGCWHFRIQLPPGIHAQPDWFRSCVDGTYGEVMKCFREWKISGDTAWMKSLWPELKRAMEYTWSDRNPDRWDPTRSGVLTGRQHHTLDRELFGPSGWLQAHYLGGLKAAEQMALACGEKEFAQQCHEIYLKGRKITEETLFNGEYYFQKVDLHDRDQLLPYLQGTETLEDNPYWNDEHKELKYQIGEGCSIDSHLGQWYATLYGLGEILSPDQIHSTLKAIYRYNFHSSMREVINTWRIYSVEDEAGTVMCSWPKGCYMPVIPLAYNCETMTGFEWAAACHCIMSGMLEEGERMAAAIRGRYTGDNRNPWNEIECGSNYARSMAAYAMLQAYSGFSYDMTCGRIGFAPVVTGDFRCFWSLGIIWGIYERKDGAQIIRVLHGSASFRQFALKDATAIALNGQKLPVQLAEGMLHCQVTVKAGDILCF